MSARSSDGWLTSTKGKLAAGHWDENVQYCIPDLITTMDAYETLAKAIAKRSTRVVVREMFTANPIGPAVGYFREDELWDYKENVPPAGKGNDAEWAKIAADVLAFHNNRGGVLVFGVRDKNYAFVGATHVIDTKLFNDKIRKYIGDRFWVSYSREFIQADQRYLGIAVIPPKSHAPILAMADGPAVGGKPILKVGDLCIRVRDETRILRGTEALKVAAEYRIGSNALYIYDEPNYRVLRPDYRQFTYRAKICAMLEDSLSSQRTFVTSLTGIGGVGKTALASWATVRAYEKRAFDFIVSVTAKDRALSTRGIVPVTPNLASLDDLIRAICETTGFTEYLERESVDERLSLVCKNILAQFRGLLLVDNLETVDDPRIIDFLEKLPLPTRAIVTSRKIRVRVACLPIEVGSFEQDEAIPFLCETARTTGKHFIPEIASQHQSAIVEACDRIPLVIEWFVGRARNAEQAVAHATSLGSEGKHGDELVEFCFRRVYNELTEKQKPILKVLALIGSPMPIEAIAAGSGLTIPEVADAVEELREYSLIERQYDTNYRDVVYSLLPVTTTFAYKEVAKASGYEDAVRRQLTAWYQAKEIKDPVERSLMQKVRRGERNPELAFLQIGNDVLNGPKPLDAERYYKLGLERNPRSWQLHVAAASFYAKWKKDISLAN